jgi:quercetin dioxygenase-like cupin family protein
MPRVIARPTVIAAAGLKPKQIEEFVGRVNSDDARLSVARMRSPGGWEEPGQCPEFLEVTCVLRGAVYVEHATGTTIVSAGQSVITEPGEWIRYSTPLPEGAEYVAVCLPAFSPATVHRDADFGGPAGPGSRSPRRIDGPTLSGQVCVESNGTRYVAGAGQAIVTEPGERVQYSTPDDDADYIAVCLPAFALDAARRDPA